jgi:hypothetical protein
MDRKHRNDMVVQSVGWVIRGSRRSKTLGQPPQGISTLDALFGLVWST